MLRKVFWGLDPSRLGLGGLSVALGDLASSSPFIATDCVPYADPISNSYLINLIVDCGLS